MRKLRRYTITQVLHCQQSGLSRSDYSRRYGIPESTVQYLRTLNVEHLDNPSADTILTDRKVWAILVDCEINTPAEVAARHGLTRQRVWRIVKGEAYRHVYDEYFKLRGRNKITSWDVLTSNWIPPTDDNFIRQQECQGI